MAVVGLACVGLPYAVSAVREAWWLIVLPLVLGLALVALGGAVSERWSPAVRRSGIGLLVAFAGFALTLAAVLVAIGIASLFRH